MTTPAAEVPVPTKPAPSPTLWVERIGDKTYVGRNERGALVRIGPGAEDTFTPGELLKLALAACSTMSAERPVLRRLGAEGPIHAGVSSVKTPGENRYGTLLTELVLPIGGVPPEEHAQYEAIARRAVDKGCTVGRTLAAGAHVVLTVADEA